MKTGKGIFGSLEIWPSKVEGGTAPSAGWSICYENPTNGRLSGSLISLLEDKNISGGKPILVMNGWQRAYFVDYKPMAYSTYIDALLSSIDWDSLDERLLNI